MQGRVSRSWRRTFIAAVAALLVSGTIAGPTSAAPTNPRAVANLSAEITLMSTADVHCHVLNWDYFKNAPSSGLGLARISTLVNEVRAERGRDSTLLFDIGDTIQGTPLCTYYNVNDPITNGGPDPVAEAMNAIGYDAMTVGNHEFNFGLPILDAFEQQLDFPMLGANVLTAGTDQPALQPYVIDTIKLPGKQPIRVGVLGLTTPGSAVWDRGHVEGTLDFADGVATAKKYVPQMIAQGADIIVAAVHAGMDGATSYGDEIPYPENFGETLAQEVPGIDVVFPAHSHQVIAQEYVTNEQTGEQVLVTQPGSYGAYLSVATLDLQKVTGKWQITSDSAKLLAAKTAVDDPAIVALVQAQHDTVVNWVNQPIGKTLSDLSLAQADYKDVPAMDLINSVQAEAVREGLAGTQYANLPVLSTTAPLSRVVIPAGPVSIKDISALYIYENTLRGVLLTGSQIKDYLERAAQYFKPVTGTGPFTPSQVTGASHMATYCYDVVYGVSYDIDLSQAVGSRVTDLTFASQPIDPNGQFVLAINNYRNDGGCGYPNVSTAPKVYNVNPDIQSLIVSWFEANEVIDPSTFGSVDWQLTYQGTPITINP
jgi:2',3'-cyclic-nucleotide 2'-phosphodiesterase/3'-nucleotidase